MGSVPVQEPCFTNFVGEFGVDREDSCGRGSELPNESLLERLSHRPNPPERPLLSEGGRQWNTQSFNLSDGEPATVRLAGLAGC